MSEFGIFIATMVGGGFFLLVGPMLMHLADRAITRTAGRMIGLSDEEINWMIQRDDIGSSR